MSLDLHWFIPAGGDGRELGHSALHGAGSSAPGFRPPSPAHLRLVARLAERAGFDGAMLPFGPTQLDPWPLAAWLAQDTRRLRLLLSYRPGLEGPVAFARRAAALQRLSGGRLVLNIVAGSQDAEQRAYGDPLDHDARYARAAEVLQIARAVWAGEAVEHAGPHLLVHRPAEPAAAVAAPVLHIGGASPAAEQLALRHGDALALWGETPPAVAARVARLRAAPRGRPDPLRFVLRVHVIAREQAATAWAEADRLLAGLTAAQVERAQQQLARVESVGQARMRALHGGRLVRHARALEVHPNLWAGIGLVRGGAGTALVGSHEQVVDRLREYAAAGIGSFVLSGYPNLEEGERLGRELLPRLRAAGFQPA